MAGSPASTRLHLATMGREHCDAAPPPANPTTIDAIEPTPLSPDEAAFLTEYRAWRNQNHIAGRSLAVMVRIDFGRDGTFSTDGRAQRGKW